jgi:transcriptional regulator with XRE-family HTH domain
MPKKRYRALSPEHLALGRAVRELRVRREMTQEDLAFVSRLQGEETGVHRNYIGAIERGEVNVTLRTMMRITFGLDVPLSMLIRLFERRLPRS